MEDTKTWLMRLISKKLQFGDDYATRAMQRLIEAIPDDDPDRKRFDQRGRRPCDNNQKRS